MNEQLDKWLDENYPEQKVYMMIDETIPEFINSDWEDEYENEFEAYQEQGRGEAENQVVTQIINEFLNGESVDIDKWIELQEHICDKYYIIL